MEAGVEEEVGAVVVVVGVGILLVGVAVVRSAVPKEREEAAEGRVECTSRFLTPHRIRPLHRRRQNTNHMAPAAAAVVALLKTTNKAVMTRMAVGAPGGYPPPSPSPLHSRWVFPHANHHDTLRSNITSGLELI